MAADWSRRRDPRDHEQRQRAREESMRPASPEEESYGGRGREHVGQEQQGGWRGPGEMPGYREAAPRRPRPFLQQSSGGQTPGELREWDRPGPHAGRGPRGYRRPDQRIHEELCERLTADPWVDARDIEVEVSDARVTLRGAVPERSMKHRAEDLADGIFGVADVDNQIRVQRRGGSRAGEASEDTRARPEDAGREGGDREEDRH